MRPQILLLTLCAVVMLLAGCSGQIPGGGIIGNTPVSGQTITYDGAINLSIKNGQPLAGTNLGYQGKSTDGRALLVIGSLQAPKQSLDSVTYKGSPVAGVVLDLSTRVGTYDQNTVNLIGTIHIEIQDPHPTANPPAAAQLTAYALPVQYNVNLNETIPGTLIQYLGQTPDGAKFSNVGEFPYRQQFDSVVWSGHLRDKVGLSLDLRLVSASEDKAALAGTAQIRFEK
ncbi:MAG: hypothetical protein WCF84_16395 [Anaerolineae bacterium]